MRKAIPLDTVIVLIRKENSFADFVSDLEKALNRKVEILDALYYVTALLNSTVSENVLRAKATRVKGNYYTIDERYLSEMIIPKPSPDDRELIERMIHSAKQCSDQPYHCNVDKVRMLADELYKIVIERVYRS